MQRQIAVSISLLILLVACGSQSGIPQPGAGHAISTATQCIYDFPPLPRGADACSYYTYLATLSEHGFAACKFTCDNTHELTSCGTYSPGFSCLASKYAALAKQACGKTGPVIKIQPPQSSTCEWPSLQSLAEPSSFIPAPSCSPDVGKDCNRLKGCGTGLIQCDKSCSAPLPVLPANFRQACNCGGIIRCDGVSCSLPPCPTGQTCDLSGKCVAPAPLAIAPPPLPTGATAPGPKTVDVVIQSFAFSPTSINVNVGDTVRFTNRDPVPHTATDDTSTFDTGMLTTGQTKTVAFNTAGTFAYHCAIHASMHGTIIVTGPAAPAPPATQLPTPVAPALPSCTDAIKNGVETDVDCGGTCPKCTLGKICGTTADCSNSICTNGQCVANKAPVITSTAPASVTQGTQYVYDIKATDPDSAPNPLSYRIISGNAGITTCCGHFYLDTASLGAGQYSFTVGVSDGLAETTQSFAFTVKVACSGSQGNSCGTCNTGRIDCNGNCQGSYTPSGSYGSYGNSCGCGGTVQCNGQCNNVCTSGIPCVNGHCGQKQYTDAPVSYRSPDIGIYSACGSDNMCPLGGGPAPNCANGVVGFATTFSCPPNYPNIDDASSVHVLCGLSNSNTAAPYQVGAAGTIANVICQRNCPSCKGSCYGFNSMSGTLHCYTWV